MTLLVDVVDKEGVLVDKGHLDAVDDELVVLELVAVALAVLVLKLVSELFVLADSLGELVDVLEGGIDLVILGELVPDFVRAGDLDIVGELVLVFDVLTLPVVVFVIGGVLDNFAEDVEVRVGAIVLDSAADDDEVFEATAVCVFGNVGSIVADGADVTVCRRLA